ncbi:hypothetical protein EDB92DRAFT_1484203 [Lactarius akahatsu]|uniref:Uncharacterized protein n=1 Tax=Lactarius akahatsu TaxID=416441 RepID=A0AAD4L6K9_9AGAM|nr:hypothetical protein EDB92DRAFT_1484203 [Lactarius akahatsu]
MVCRFKLSIVKYRSGATLGTHMSHGQIVAHLTLTALSTKPAIPSNIRSFSNKEERGLRKECPLSFIIHHAWSSWCLPLCYSSIATILCFHITHSKWIPHEYPCAIVPLPDLTGVFRPFRAARCSSCRSCSFRQRKSSSSSPASRFSSDVVHKLAEHDVHLAGHARPSATSVTSRASPEVPSLNHHRTRCRGERLADQGPPAPAIDLPPCRVSVAPRTRVYDGPNPQRWAIYGGVAGTVAGY